MISSAPLRPTTLEIAAGATFLAIGLLFNVWAERLFRWNNVGVCPFTHVPGLILRGPYRVTRNPMYLGLVCLNLSVTFFSGALANIWSSVALFIWLHYAFVLPEEVFLRAQLGSTFDEYARHVPRWLSMPQSK
jgi:protein-S-isoprenylcysteine O-methyltransferase Ste14